MSARLVATTRPKRSAALFVALATLGGLACGPFAAPERAAGAPPPAQTTGAKDKAPEDGAGAPRDPLPADAPRRKAYEQLQVPNRNRATYDAIEDFKPVARQDQNPREHDAWIELVLHASARTVGELNEYAIRDLVPLDLIKMARAFRAELIRFDGRLVCVRRLVPPPLLQSSVVPELYEARLVPLDESPLTPVSVVFSELPPTLAAVKDRAPEEWLDADGWVTASGYFFKTMSVPGERANKAVSLPLLIGKGLTPLPGPPAGTPTPTALDRDLRIYKFIRDDVKMARTAPTEATWPEVAAYNRVVLHASRFTAEELERDASTDLRFADLFEDSRVAHRLACVRFEGRLISLRRLDTNEWLGAAGVAQLYEGWMVPGDERSGHPICVVFTEPLEGVEPARRVNKWVSFAGYSFKRMRYESAEEDAKNPSKHVDKLAPLLIGRAPIARPDPDESTALGWGPLVNAAVIGSALLVLSAGAFAWWYRGGDRKAREQIDAVRGRNPFDPDANPTAAG